MGCDIQIKKIIFDFRCVPLVLRGVAVPLAAGHHGAGGVRLPLLSRPPLPRPQPCLPRGGRAAGAPGRGQLGACWPRAASGEWTLVVRIVELTGCTIRAYAHFRR